MTANLVCSAIVPEVLKIGNFETWISCLENYLVGQDLWDTIFEPKPEENEAEFKTWRIKNAMALHAIKISCGVDMISQITKINSAKDALIFLGKMSLVRKPASSSGVITMQKPQAQGEVREPSSSSGVPAMQKPQPQGEFCEPVSSSGVPTMQKPQAQGEVCEPGSSSGVPTMQKPQPQGEVREPVSSAGVPAMQKPQPQGEVREPGSSSGVPSMQKPQAQGEVCEPGSSSGVPAVGGIDLEPFTKAVWSLNWDAAKSFLASHSDAVRVKGYNGETILHRAVVDGQVKIVEGLVQLMSERDLEERESAGRTALDIAAQIGITRMAECMIEKNINLVSIGDNNGGIPIVRACTSAHYTMVRYLYTVTPLEELTTAEKMKNGATLLSYCIVGKMFDIALDLVRKCRPLAVALDKNGDSPMYILSRIPSAFHGGSQLVFWRRWIYACISIQQPCASDDFRINIQRAHQRQNDRGSIIITAFGKLHGLFSDLIELIGIKQMYNQKLIHVQAHELVCHIAKEIPDLSLAEREKSLLYKALFQAVKYGIVEFVVEITKVNPSLLWFIDTKNKRSIFQSAIVYRQEKIFSLVYGLDACKDSLKSDHDRFRNNMLHLAGMLAPSTRLDGISGAALQMQRELQWFKEVENVVSPMLKEMPNLDGQIPRELFTEKHRELVKEGQKWMKETATSCTVVAALIVTIMFTAAFTVPGGNNGNSGYPILLKEKLFKLFLVCDAISFLSSTTSILIFLGILTARYGEEYFLKSLPTKMIIGLTSLFISIGTMTIAFFAALFLMQGGQSSRVFIPVLLLASVPITLFVILQFPLLSEIFNSTYRSGIFNRRQERWY